MTFYGRGPCVCGDISWLSEVFDVCDQCSMHQRDQEVVDAVLCEDK